jgi:hypothetical protein
MPLLVILILIFDFNGIIFINQGETCADRERSGGDNQEGSL